MHSQPGIIICAWSADNEFDDKGHPATTTRFVFIKIIHCNIKQSQREYPLTQYVFWAGPSVLKTLDHCRKQTSSSNYFTLKTNYPLIYHNLIRRNIKEWRITLMTRQSRLVWVKSHLVWVELCLTFPLWTEWRAECLLTTSLVGGENRYQLAVSSKQSTKSQDARLTSWKLHFM